MLNDEYDDNYSNQHHNYQSHPLSLNELANKRLSISKYPQNDDDYDYENENEDYQYNNADNEEGDDDDNNRKYNNYYEEEEEEEEDRQQNEEEDFEEDDEEDEDDVDNDNDNDDIDETNEPVIFDYDKSSSLGSTIMLQKTVELVSAHKLAIAEMVEVS